MVFNARTQVPLAKDKVRHVGEPLAMVVADSRYLAEDALADIAVRTRAAEGGGRSRGGAGARSAPRVHDDLRRTSPRTCTSARATTPAPRARPTWSIARRFLYDRGTAAAMENRGVVASWDARAEQLTVWDTTQAPIPIRNGLARDARPVRSARCG